MLTDRCEVVTPNTRRPRDPQAIWNKVKIRSNYIEVFQFSVSLVFVRKKTHSVRLFLLTQNSMVGVSVSKAKI